MPGPIARCDVQAMQRVVWRHRNLVPVAGIDLPHRQAIKNAFGAVPQACLHLGRLTGQKIRRKRIGRAVAVCAIVAKQSDVLARDQSEIRRTRSMI